MSREGDNGGRTGRDADLGATEEMPTHGPLSSRRRLAPAVPAARPSEPVQLARGQSSGESQAAYATGPKSIPPSRHASGNDPSPAVIVDGAQAHTYEPLETPPPSSSRGGLYLAPVPAFPPGGYPQRGGTVPMAPAFSAPQFASPPPVMRGRSRSETVVITMPGRKRGPSSREKVLAFVVVLVIVALLGIIFLLWKGLDQRRSEAVPEPAPPATVATAAIETKPVVEPPPVVVTPPVAVVGGPLVVDAGAKKPPKKTH